MSILYFALAPLFLIGLFKRIKEIVSAIKEKNSDKIKAEMLFLGLTIVVTVIMIMIIEMS